MIKHYGVEMEASAPFGLSRRTFELARAEESSSNGTKRVDMQEEMLGLLQSIEFLLPATAHKMIVIIGSKEGEGTSTIAREFARVTSSLAGKSVLLLDADRTNPSHHLFFKIPSGHGWLEAIKHGSAVDRALYQVGSSSLFISPCSSSTFTASEILSSNSADAFWNEVRHRFDFVIVDSAPLIKAPDSLAILPKADGALLVVGAESTERTLAENAKGRIEKVGGKIIGVIFNKERQYIPQFIGKCLQ
jgi:capsular exopolysaccharide synthesis family protein